MLISFIQDGASQAFVFQSLLIIQTLDNINMPVHSDAPSSSSSSVSAAASETVILLAHHALITIWISQCAPCTLFCVTRSHRGRAEMLRFLLCVSSCAFQAFAIRYWGNRSRQREEFTQSREIITGESQPCSVFPCLVVGNLSGIHSNTWEFGASN